MNPTNIEEGFRHLLVKCEMVAAGTVRLMTSTGGSTNAHVQIQDVLKGPRSCDRLVVAFSSINGAERPEMETGSRYIFLLSPLPGITRNVYALVDDDPRAIVSFDQEILDEIRNCLGVRAD